MDERLTFIDKPVFILARDVRSVHAREIHMVKIQWAYHLVEEAT